MFSRDPRRTTLHGLSRPGATAYIRAWQTRSCVAQTLADCRDAAAFSIIALPERDVGGGRGNGARKQNRIFVSALAALSAAGDDLADLGGEASLGECADSTARASAQPKLAGLHWPQCRRPSCPECQVLSDE